MKSSNHIEDIQKLLLLPLYPTTLYNILFNLGSLGNIMCYLSFSLCLFLFLFICN